VHAASRAKSRPGGINRAVKKRAILNDEFLILNEGIEIVLKLKIQN
jgi:hypothetical protein